MIYLVTNFFYLKCVDYSSILDLFTYHLLAVRSMHIWRLDAGTYESECVVFLGQGNRERLIIKYGNNENITEVIKFEARYEDASCKKLGLETSLVYSVNLVSGTISDEYTPLLMFREWLIYRKQYRYSNPYWWLWRIFFEQWYCVLAEVEEGQDI